MQCFNCGGKVETEGYYCAECNREQQRHKPKYQKSQEGWNWWAFLFGPLWYLVKGMIAKALLLFLIAGALNIGTDIYIGTILVSFYCGACGETDYRKSTS